MCKTARRVKERGGPKLLSFRLLLSAGAALGGDVAWVERLFNPLSLLRRQTLPYRLVGLGSGVGTQGRGLETREFLKAETGRTQTGTASYLVDARCCLGRAVDYAEASLSALRGYDESGSTPSRVKRQTNSKGYVMTDRIEDRAGDGQLPM